VSDRVLSDPKVYPSDHVLASHLRRANAAYRSLFEYKHAQFPTFTERWRYYNDGKQWLLNVSNKKKTLFWLVVNDGSFRTTFYFASRHEPLVVKSDLPASLKKQYAASAGKTFRPISLLIKSKKNIEEYKKLLALKLDTL
jgi:hypothetical protein